MQPYSPDTSTTPKKADPGYGQLTPLAMLSPLLQVGEKDGELYAGPSSSSLIGSPVNGKKPVRDSKRRATHSQIERRRREKINDRLVTLRSIVPACAAEIEERKRARREEDEESRRLAAGGVGSGSLRNGKRKRNRRRASTSKENAGCEKDEELGLHKLEVLTHTIEYIYELQKTIDLLQREAVPLHQEAILPERMHKDGQRPLQNSSLTFDTRRRAEETPRFAIPLGTDSFRRHSPASSCSTSDQETSPPFSAASKTDKSPFFSSTSSSVSCLTSPMMSLSAESPLFNLAHHDGSASWKHAGGSQEGIDNDTSGGRGRSWQMLPAPLLPIYSGESASQKQLPVSNLTHQSRADAHLLLSLKKSTTPLRPMSAMRQTSGDDWVSRRRSATLRSGDGPGGVNKAGNSRSTIRTDVSQSAPGGAFPERRTALLPSPPLFALDTTSSSSSTATDCGRLHNNAS